MGGLLDEAIEGDGEGPPRKVTRRRLSRSAAPPSPIAQFAAFVRATRYVTEAERLGASFVFYLQLEQPARNRIRRTPAGLPWWVEVPDACWQRPEGAGFDVNDRPGHPVVHVSWHDAQAYCRWSGTQLPSEAQWEYAARGGLDAARYPWGDSTDFEARCNVWRGDFPSGPATGWQPGPVAVHALPPNGHGLHHATGNVWQWCADWFSPSYHLDTPDTDPRQDRISGRRSMRGGSFLCHASYCHRYRVAARSSNAPSSTSSNCGFRVAR